MPVSREEAVYLARVAEQAERPGDMLEKMNHVISFDQELTIEERNLLAVAYKNFIGICMNQWKVIALAESREAWKGKESLVSKIVAFKEKIESELGNLYYILDILEKRLIPSATSDESKVFYLKMMGDYHRWITRFAAGDKLQDSIEKSLNAYQAASAIAVTKLPSTNVVRLGLALNFSMYYYDVLHSPDRAIQLAKQTFDDACTELNTISDRDYADCTLLMQLLKDEAERWEWECMEGSDS